jgi:hypothetical protein
VRCLGILILAGCGASTGGPTLGGPCDAKNACNKGEVCDYTADGGPICIEGAGDIDGDGIPNDKDFCEHVMGGRFDEDRDGIGDECDPCPIAPPPATPDPDGDAVDSPCDPDPHTPGERILMFDGFNGSALDARWKATTASAWTQVGGEVVADVAAIPTEDYLSANSGEAVHYAVLASYRIDQIGNGATTHLVAIRGIDPRPAGVAQFECGIVHADQGTSDVVDLETNVNNASTTAKGGFNTASLYELAASTDAGQVGCSAIADNKASGAVTAPITPDALATVRLGARAVKVRFQWVLVVGR